MQDILDMLFLLDQMASICILKFVCLVRELILQFGQMLISQQKILLFILLVRESVAQFAQLNHLNRLLQLNHPSLKRLLLLRMVVGMCAKDQVWNTTLSDRLLAHKTENQLVLTILKLKINGIKLFMAMQAQPQSKAIHEVYYE